MPLARGVLLIGVGLFGVGLWGVGACGTIEAQEARRRWETMNQIRRDKFDLVLPEAMRENGIDMWITMIREANYEPLWPDLGFGYTGQTGY
jgi:hypothetical protein